LRQVKCRSHTGHILVGKSDFARCLAMLILYSGLLIYILYHFYEQALRPVPQQNSILVEQAGEPVAKETICL